MLFQYQRASRIIEVLNDLLRINNDRIAAYTYALNLASPEAGLRDIFDGIIADAKYYKSQLTGKIKSLNGDPLSGSTLPGKIYRAWMVLKVTFPGTTRDAIITSCLRNEEIALHAYSIALSSNIDFGADIRHIIERQEAELRKSYTLISQQRESNMTPKTRLTFFL